MFLQRCGRRLALRYQLYNTSSSLRQADKNASLGQKCNIRPHARLFWSSSRVCAVQPYLLADIGEGITECQVISWAVKEGDSIEQFGPICEVQSDKASVENGATDTEGQITSRFDGVVKKLHYREGDMAKVGSALMDIDVAHDEGVDSEQLPLDTEVSREAREEDSTPSIPSNYEDQSAPLTLQATSSINADLGDTVSSNSWTSVLATPAVRRLLTQHGLDITKIQGSGKDGRVLKNDVIEHIQAHDNKTRALRQPAMESQARTQSNEINSTPEGGEAQRIKLSPIQNAMFKSMTASLSIPHFLFTHNVDLTSLSKLINKLKTDARLTSRLTDETGVPVKLTLLPFVLKALSQAARQFPFINSSVDTNGSEPGMLLHGTHNFGLAVDTPNGLVVPVVHDVQNHSIQSLAFEISRLAKLAKAGKLVPADMADATLVVSNIGSIGGNVVAPVILSPMTAIVAIGQTESVPSFETGEDGIERIVKKEKTVLSWSADHRLLDGATVARCAQEVATWLEKPELFILSDA